MMLGDAAVGKTSLTIRYISGFFLDDLKLTIGVDFYSKTTKFNEKKVKLQIWDFGGEERFRFLLPSYVRGANGGLFMYDVSNYSSIAHIDDWLMILNKEAPENQFPILVVGGKADLVNDREVSSEEGINIAKSRGVDGFVECSSKSGENVDITFEAITKLMLQHSNII